MPKYDSAPYREAIKHLHDSGGTIEFEVIEPAEFSPPYIQIYKRAGRFCKCPIARIFHKEGEGYRLVDDTLMNVLQGDVEILNEYYPYPWRPHQPEQYNPGA